MGDNLCYICDAVIDPAAWCCDKCWGKDGQTFMKIDKYIRSLEAAYRGELEYQAKRKFARRPEDGA